MFRRMTAAWQPGQKDEVDFWKDKMRKAIVSAVSLFVLVLAAGAKADEISDLKSQLAEQQKLLFQMQERLEQLEASQKAQEQKVDEKISKVVETKQIAALHQCSSVC